MSTGLHRDLALSERHAPHSFEYADAATRTGASGFVSGDLGKIAKQLDDNTLWQLTAVTPTWRQVDAGGVSPSRNVGTNNGLQGGGDLSADRTLSPVYGSSVNTVCQGNDARLSDARTPSAHATSHKSGQSDAIKLDELAAPTDITTLNADTGKHGLLPKLGGGTANFLRADGTWATPTATPSVHANEAHDPDMLTVGSNRSDGNLDKLTDGDEDDDVDALHLHIRCDKSKAYLWDDFVGNAMDAALWATTLSGTGSAAGVLSTGLGGSLRLTSGGAVDRYAILTAGTKYNWSYDKKAVLDCRFKIVDLADSYNIIALRNDDNNRAYLIRTNSGNWLSYTVLSGTPTGPTDTLIAADTNWHTFKISCEAGQIVFKIDGVTKATHATNLPTAQMEPFFLQRTSAGSATRASYLDWVEIVGERD